MIRSNCINCAVADSWIGAQETCSLPSVWDAFFSLLCCLVPMHCFGSSTTTFPPEIAHRQCIFGDSMLVNMGIYCIDDGEQSPCPCSASALRCLTIWVSQPSMVLCIRYEGWVPLDPITPQRYLTCCHVSFLASSGPPQLHRRLRGELPAGSGRGCHHVR